MEARHRLVSHDREEIYRLSYRIAVWKRVGDMYTRKKELFVIGPLAAARLTGCENISCFA